MHCSKIWHVAYGVWRMTLDTVLERKTKHTLVAYASIGQRWQHFLGENLAYEARGIRQLCGSCCLIRALHRIAALLLC